MKDEKETKQKRPRISQTYTLRAAQENTRRLLDQNLISQEEYDIIIEIQRAAALKYITL